MDKDEVRDAAFDHTKEQHSADVKSELASGDPNVAVIAIHGVGQHLSGASADAVSTLLMSIRREEVTWGAGKEKGAEPASFYSGFVATSIDVPLRPIQAPQDGPNDANYRKEDGNSWRRMWTMFDERRGYLAKARGKPGEKIFGYDANELRKGEPDRGELAYQFMLTKWPAMKASPTEAFRPFAWRGNEKQIPRLRRCTSTMRTTPI